MATAAAQTRWQPEDLLSMRDEGRFELVDGQLVERNMGAESSLVAGELRGLMRNFANKLAIGRIYGPDCGFQIFQGARDKVRFTDGAFIRKGRLLGDKPPKGHCRVAPDLAIEAVSPNDTAREVEEKVEEWLSAGVRLVWVLYPDTRRIHVHRKDGTTTKLQQKDMLRGERVLPGFKCRVADVFKGI